MRLSKLAVVAVLALSSTVASAGCSLEWQKQLGAVLDVQRQATQNAMKQSMVASTMRTAAVLNPNNLPAQQAMRESAAVAAEAVRLWKVSDDLLDRVINHPCAKQQ